MLKKIILLLLIAFAQNVFAQQTLSLQQAIEMVLKNNYDISIAKNKIEVSQLNSDGSISNFLPKAAISISKSGSINSIEQKFLNNTETKKNGVIGNNFNPSLVASWTLFDGMKMFATKHKLKNLVAIGELNYKDTLQNCVAQTIVVYNDIIAAQMQLKAIHEAINLAQERVTITEKQFLVGSSSKVDWLQARVDLNEQKSILLTQQNIYEQKKLELNKLMSMPSDNLFTVTDSISFNDKLSLMGETELDKSNFQLLIANKIRENSYFSKKEIFSSYLPQLTVNGAYGLSRSSNTAGFSLLNQTQGFSGGISLYIPLFNGTQTNNQVKAANINALNTEMQYKKIQLQTSIKYYKAKLDFKKAKEILQLESENIQLAKENLSIATERFRLGQSNAIEMRQAESSYSNAMNRYVQAQFNAKSVETELLRLMGKLVE
ncbi:MAG: hypothetical protein RL065_376 [Bacteroidota bacterium]|jgi:outer membrane protein TolC